MQDEGNNLSNFCPPNYCGVFLKHRNKFCSCLTKWARVRFFPQVTSISSLSLRPSFSFSFSLSGLLSLSLSLFLTFSLSHFFLSFSLSIFTNLLPIFLCTFSLFLSMFQPHTVHPSFFLSSSFTFSHLIHLIHSLSFSYNFSLSFSLSFSRYPSPCLSHMHIPS